MAAIQADMQFIASPPGPAAPPALAVMPRDAAATDPAAVIATHALRALAVMAAFENARAELAHSSQLLCDIGERVGGRAAA